MWKWEYTDDSGQRRVSRWLMTEHEALRYKDAVRVERTLQTVFLRPPVKQPCFRWVAQRGFISGVQGVLWRTIAFRMVSILRMQATMATL